jgi:glucosamine--fructose-6-phosphate aminotransferase (isomerizing)
MCGIIGYVGRREAKPILLEGLRHLEYRGYDSAGIAIKGNKGVQLHKAVGDLDKLLESLPPMKGKLGIGHTRWATHGKVSKANAHPLSDCKREFFIVHNGVIENFKELKKELANRGHCFASQTDSELIAHLIEENYSGSFEEAFTNSLVRLKGSFAIAAISKREDLLVGARNGSPLIIGIGDEERLLASDIPALIKFTNKIIYLEDEEIALLKQDKVWIKRFDGRQIKRKARLIDQSPEAIEKAGFEHFMLKEIYEQPQTLYNALVGRISLLEPQINLDFDLVEEAKHVDSIAIIGCGTSFNAGYIGKYLLESLLGLPVSIEYASEYKYFTRKEPNQLALVITQSGETADAIEALKEAKRSGCKTLLLTNIKESTAARLADYTLLNRAGQEIGVAATKTFTSQIVLLELIGLWLGKLLGKIGANDLLEIVNAMWALPRKLQVLLDSSDLIKKSVKLFKGVKDVFLVGRGIDYPVALEGALKIKEIAYLHAEAFPAGELKHGPFALLTPEAAVIGILTNPKTYEKMLLNLSEIKARGAKLLALAWEGDQEAKKLVDWVIPIPKTLPELSPILTSVALQLLAYWLAKHRNCPIDKPRNLAKSVTVE